MVGRSNSRRTCRCGREHFEDDGLRFFETMRNASPATARTSCCCRACSSAFPSLYGRCGAARARHAARDRRSDGFLAADRDRLTVQTVPDGSIPPAIRRGFSAKPSSPRRSPRPAIAGGRLRGSDDSPRRTRPVLQGLHLRTAAAPRCRHDPPLLHLLRSPVPAERAGAGRVAAPPLPRLPAVGALPGRRLARGACGAGDRGGLADQPCRLRARRRGARRGEAKRPVDDNHFTCTPSLPLFVLRREAAVDAITYLDADLFFFSDPAAAVRGDRLQLGGNHPAPFPGGERAAFERYGIFNVGWLTFRRNDAALACLTWWRERCLEWCFDREEPSRFADQKYLDDWPSRFEDVHVVRHKGANVASWNLANYAHDAARRQGVRRRRAADFLPLPSPQAAADVVVRDRLRATRRPPEPGPQGTRVHALLPAPRRARRPTVAGVLDTAAAEQLRPTARAAARLPLVAGLSDFASGNLMLYVGGRVREPHGSTLHAPSSSARRRSA